jgi:D-serine dehydratase
MTETSAAPALRTLTARPAPALPRYRSLPDPTTPPDQVGGRGWRLGDLPLPAMTLRESAIEHNIALHADWCRSVDVSQAPHAKTHLSPEIINLQLARGAWGMTAATAHQARFLAALDVPNIILAHQVVDPAGIKVLGLIAANHPDVTTHILVDSLDGVAALAAHLPADAARPQAVLVELGVDSGRTGVRDDRDVDTIVAAVLASPALRLSGIECYEGVLPIGRAPENLAAVDALVARLPELAARLDAEGAFAGAQEIILTGGGSVYPDRVAAMARPQLSLPVRVVVRSGGVIVHDYGSRARSAPLAPEAAHPMGSLRPALELWAAIVSTPEPGLALAGGGKRDAPYDNELPVVLEVRRGAETVPSGGVEIKALNDQHAFVAHDGVLRVGDVLRLGPVHPCTSFDKWPLIPLLDDEDAVVGAITTWF